MPKLKQILLLFTILFSLNIFSQTTIDSLIFDKLNTIRKREGVSLVNFEPYLYRVSSTYASFVKDYYNNIPLKNTDKEVNVMFEKTSNIYNELIVEERGIFAENVKEIYLFLSSKNNFYSDEELSNIILSIILKNYNHKEDLIFSNYKNIGIACIHETTLYYKQVVFCIISFE